MLTLGGGTHSGTIGDVLVEFIALPVIGSSIVGLLSDPWPTARRPVLCLAFSAAFIVLPLMQLVPLPPTIASHLGAAAEIGQTGSLLGTAMLWRPISVLPQATWLAWLSLLPALALFWAVCLLEWPQRRRLVVAIMAVGAVSALLGLVQIAQGPNSSLRFYSVTNLSDAVGFFANRNHFAALLYCVVPFTGAFAIGLTERWISQSRSRNFDSSAILGVAVVGALLFALIAAQAMARSRAGMTLTLLAVLGTFAMTIGAGRSRSTQVSARLAIGFTALVAVTCIVELALYRALERFAYESLEADARLGFGRNTAQAAWSFMPFGSGLGTFVRVYGMFDRPADIVANAFVNHAHNDWLELWLETGLAGIVLLGVFLIWFCYRSIAAWARAFRADADIDRLLAVAATLVVLLLLLHSFVDYALRTQAMMAVLAVALGVLINPPEGSAPSAHLSAEEQSHAVPRRSLRARPALASARRPNQQLSERATKALSDTPWRNDHNWPASWRDVEPPRERDVNNTQGDENDATKPPVGSASDGDA
jgi:O-antigen ligase